MMEKICNCKIPKNLQEDLMVESIKNYIANLDPKDCVEDYKYEDRLNKCSICEALVGGLTCRYCGCFVLARAKKKDMNCPMPGCDKWK